MAFEKHFLSPRTPGKPPTASNHLKTQPWCGPLNTARSKRACSSELQLRGGEQTVKTLRHNHRPYEIVFSVKKTMRRI